MAPERLREVDFNREPIGTGPFVFTRLQVIDPNEGRMSVYLTSNHRYMRGQPRLDRMQLHVFKNSAQVKKSLLLQEINAATDLNSDEVHEIVSSDSSSLAYRTPVLDGMYAFLRNDAPLFSDVTVRKAFVMATDRRALISSLHTYASPLEGPLTVDQLPTIASKRQAPYDRAKAAALLDQAGWKLQGQKRFKDGKPMTLSLLSADSGDYPKVVKELKKQWEAIGATVETKLVKPNDFQQSILLPRQYDALVYELELGADPDVYAYWHSSQADPRGLNLSNYTSTIASDALASAQLRLEPAVRVPKYEVFVNTWLDDAPAIALYQPQLHYVTTESTASIQLARTVVNRTDRYRMVEQWTVDMAWRYASP